MASERVEIELDLRGADKVYGDLQRLDDMLKGFSGAKGKRQIELNLDQARQDLLALRGEINETTRKIDEFKKKRSELYTKRSGVDKESEEWQELSESIDKVNEDLDEAQTHLKETKNEFKDMTQRVNELNYAFKNFTQMSFGKMFREMSTGIRHMGQNLQTLGNALQKVGNPFQQFTSGAIMGAGYKALNLATEGLESAFERHDIFTKFARNLEVNFGNSKEEVEALKQSLNEAVDGLPTGLDEIVNMTNKFTASMGDADRATQLAIATNNAFLASQSDETARYQGMLQLRDVIGGKDMNAREWGALAQSMLPAIRMMGEELGYTGEELRDYVQDVQSGKIANEEFLDTLIKYGTSGKIAETARLAMDTWESFFARIRTAFSRLGDGVLNALDELVTDVTNGELTSLNSFLDKKIIPAINKLSASIQDWIKAHPDEIIDFFKQLQKIDWAGLAKGMVDGLKSVSDAFQWFAGLFGDKGLQGLGWFLAVAGPLGRAINLLGGFLKGLSIPLAAIFAGAAKFGMMAMGELAKRGGLFGMLGKLFGGDGTGAIGKLKNIFGKKKALEEAGEAAESIPTVSETFKRAFKSLGGLIKAAGAVTLVAGTGLIAFESAKRILQNIKEMSDMLSEGDWSNAPIVTVGVIGAIGGFIEIFNYIGTVLGPKGLLSVAIASAASSLVTGAFAADMWMIKKGVEQIRDTIKTLDEVATSIQTMNGIGTLGEDVKQKFRNTIDAINEIKNMFVGKNGSKMDRGQVEAGLPTFSIGKVTALTNIGNAVKQLQNIASQLNSLSAISVSDPSQTIADIKTACQSLQGIRVSKGLAKQAEHIADSILQVRRIAYHINKLAGLSVNAGGFADTITQIKEALESIKGMSQTVTLDIKVVMGSGFRSSVNGVVKQLKNAKKDIEAYKKPIAFIVPVNVTFSVVTNAASAIAKMKNERARVINARNNIRTPMTVSTGGRASRNGILYRSGGGSTSRSYHSVASYRPRGTDTIPAMLTEGEYVHKKQAVDFFGVDFMRKVNNLDVKGAMNALLTKAGTSVGVGRQSIVNNTVNNNQRITQNISTNNPNFAGARMGRFVGAL